MRRRLLALGAAAVAVVGGGLAIADTHSSHPAQPAGHLWVTPIAPPKNAPDHSEPAHVVRGPQKRPRHRQRSANGVKYSLQGAPCISVDCGPYAAAIHWSLAPWGHTTTGYYVYLNNTSVGNQVDDVLGTQWVAGGGDCSTSVTLGVRQHDATGDLGPLYTAAYTTPACSVPPDCVSNCFFVSPSGNNTTGADWAHAFTNINTALASSSVASGATIVIDGGTSRCSISPYDFSGGSNEPGVTCGQRYTPPTGGYVVADNNITLKRSQQTGHNGTVVIDGGRDLLLPYCGQTTYTDPGEISTGINIAGHTGVTINGMNRSGIVIRGTLNGITMGTGGSNTVKNVEAFDNGHATQPASQSPTYASDGNGIILEGNNNTFVDDLIHDNGQDEFHAKGNAVSNSGDSISYTWMGALRESPLYAGEPFNDLQNSGDPTLGNINSCNHADGIQIFEPAGTLSGQTLDHDVFGPGINQGDYPSDAGTPTLMNNVTANNTLFLDVVSHNMEIDHCCVSGWSLDHDTFIATGTASGTASDLDTNGSMSMTNSIKYGAGWNTPGDGTTCTASNAANCWTLTGDDYWQGHALPGTTQNIDPQFTGEASIPTTGRIGFSTLESVDLTPTNASLPAGIGSPIHKLGDLYTLIDSNNGGF